MYPKAEPSSIVHELNGIECRCRIWHGICVTRVYRPLGLSSRGVLGFRDLVLPNPCLHPEVSDHIF